MNPLPPLNRKATCPKCGANKGKITLRYHVGGQFSEGCLHVVGEHFHRHCISCQYEWLEACLPAKKEDYE